MIFFYIFAAEFLKYKDMEKAIIWLRSSTDRQQSSIDEQRNDLTIAALNDGFKPKELKYIGSAGASAIKMNDQYQKEVNELIENINNRTIEVVYVWEMSRLARNELAFYTLKDTLVKNKIQLICLKPSIKLFDNDGKINSASEIQMNLLVTLAKQEMELKAERFDRAKKKMKVEGKVTTGKPMYGYYKAKDKTIQIDPAQAKVMEEIFLTYLSEDISLRNLYQRYVEMGHLKPSQHNTARMRKILCHLGYSGRSKEMPYPVIISADLQDKVIAKMKERVSKPKINHKYIWYAKGLLTAKVNGKKMSAMICRGQYLTCEYNNYKVAASVNINAVDSIAWYCGIKYKAMQLANQFLDNQETFEQDIKEKKDRIEYIKSLKENVDSKLALAFKQLINGKVSEAVYNNIQMELQVQSDRYAKSITQLNNEITTIELMQRAKDDDISYNTKLNNIEEVKDDAERKKIINDTIDEMICEITDDKTAIITVIPKFRPRLPLAMPQYFTIKEVKKRIQIKEVWRRADGEMTPIAFTGDYFKRVICEKGVRVYVPSNS